VKNVSPEKSAKRILGIDVTRGIAMIIMFMTNFAVVMDTLNDGPRWLVMLYQIIQGKGAATFVTLAGIGVSLMTRRQQEGDSDTERTKVRSTLLKRAFFLLVFGLMFYTVWTADILHYYGVYLMIASMLLYASTTTLLRTSAVFAFGFNLLLLFLDYEKGWINNWDYVGFWTPAGFTWNLLFNGIHPVFPWLSFLVMGMVMGRMDIRDKCTRKKLIIKASIIAVLSYLLSGVLCSLFAGSELVHIVGTSMMPPGILYLATAGSIGVIITMVSQNLCEEYPDSWILDLMASTGRLALTHYIGHVLLGIGLIQLLEPFIEFNLVVSLLFSVGYSIFAVVSSYFWENRFGKGPIEQVMRKITG
jgi:uncharacterized membrane protein YeiB